MKIIPIDDVNIDEESYHSEEKVFSVMANYCLSNENIKLSVLPFEQENYIDGVSDSIISGIYKRYQEIEKEAELWSTNIQIAFILTGLLIGRRYREAAINNEDLINFWDFNEQQKDFEYLEKSFLQTVKICETKHTLHIKLLNIIYSYTTEYYIWKRKESIREKQAFALSKAAIKLGACLEFNT